MGDLTPIAFDIETSGFDDNAVITVAGLAHELGDVLILNTGERHADTEQLRQQMTDQTSRTIKLFVVGTEAELLGALGDIADEYLDGDRHYLTAYHGETWNGGFDLPVIRTACVSHNIEWPFPNLAYADMLDVISRFETNDMKDLVGVYDHLIGNPTEDPFDDSSAAVEAFEEGNWEPLLAHNLADIQRTRELAVLAGSYVPQSDFRMKNLHPPDC